MGGGSHSPMSQTEEGRGYIYTTTAGGFRQHLVYIPSLLNFLLSRQALLLLFTQYIPAEEICLQLVSNATQFLGNLKWH